MENFGLPSDLGKGSEIGGVFLFSFYPRSNIGADKSLSLQSHSESVVKAKGSSRRAVEQPLAVMPITVWNPPAQSVKSPSSRLDKLKRKGSETGRDGNSLLLNAELAAGAVSSILKDSDLKRLG